MDRPTEVNTRLAPGTMILRGRDFISMDDLSAEELRHILDVATDLKRRSKAGDWPPLLAGRVLAMIFEKPSLRTRVTFETGMWELGGHAIYLAPQDIQLGARESVADVARNLERWVQVIMAQTFAHPSVYSLAEHARVLALNKTSDEE